MGGERRATDASTIRDLFPSVEVSHDLLWCPRRRDKGVGVIIPRR
jgi:hypothetical protein